MQIHTADIRTPHIGWGLRRYHDGKRMPVLVIDQARGLTRPESMGANLNGSVSLYWGGALYEGLAAPFVLPDLPIGSGETVRAFRSSADVSADHILHSGGSRSGGPPGDSFAFADADIWSASHD